MSFINGVGTSIASQSSDGGGGASYHSLYYENGETGTFVVPPGLTKIYVTGCGGGGGASYVSEQSGQSGNGGGGGAFCIKLPITVSPGDTLYIESGTAGSSSLNTPGVSGSSSSIYSATPTVIISLGGGGGGNAIYAIHSGGAAGNYYLGVAKEGFIRKGGSGGDSSPATLSNIGEGGISFTAPTSFSTGDIPDPGDSPVTYPGGTGASACGGQVSAAGYGFMLIEYYI